MDSAIVTIDKNERLISAEEFGRSGYAAWPKSMMPCCCPLCGQPVFFVAGKIQAPHFRHEKNNPRTQWCDNHSSVTEAESRQRERVPSPLFIREKQGSPGVFVTEMGLKQIKNNQLDELESEGAVLRVSGREYAVNKERLGNGMTRLPVFLSAGISFPVDPDVCLANSSHRFEDFWSPLGRSGDNVVFACDSEVLSGRKIEFGGQVSIEDRVLILSSKGINLLKPCFPGVKHVGHLHVRIGDMPVEVYLATVSERSAGYLEAHKIALESADDVPRLIWPPSLASSGEMMPLFAGSRFVFRAKAARRDGRENEGLYLHSGDLANGASMVPVQESGNPSWGVAFVRQKPGVRFLSTREWVFSSVILLEHSPEMGEARLTTTEEIPNFCLLDSEHVRVMALRDSRLELLLRDGSKEIYRLKAGAEKVVETSNCVLIRVSAKMVVAQRGEWITQRELRISPQCLDMFDFSPEHIGRQGLLAGVASDCCRAKARSMTERPLKKCGDASFALMRKAFK